MKRNHEVDEEPKFVKRFKNLTRNVVRNENDMLSVLQKFFYNQLPLAMFINNGNDLKGGMVMDGNFSQTSIISAPEEVLSFPLFDLDVDKVVNKIEDDVHEPPSCRSKFVMLVVRGHGGGKTRALEEIRRSLIEQMPTKRILVLGITFNNNTDLLVPKEYEKLPKCRSELKMAYSVVVRMCYSLFGYSFKTCKKLIRKVLQQNDIKDFSLLIRGFIRYADVVVYLYTFIIVSNCCRFAVLLVRKYQRLNGILESQLVTSFVLLVDEMKRLHDHLVRTECALQLRRCLLYSSLLHTGDNDCLQSIDIGLVISSVDIASTGGTVEAGSAIVRLLLPQRLDARKVVEKWWKIASTDVMYEQFYLLATLANNVPGHCEVVYETVVKSRAKRSKISMKKLIKFVQESINSKYNYNDIKYPSAQVLYSIVFQRIILPSDEVMQLVNDSIITNSLQNFRVDLLRPIIPQASPLVLMSLMHEEDSELGLVSGEFHLILKDIKELNFGKEIEFVEVVETVKKLQVGDLLETLFCRWLTIRSYLNILASKEKSEIPLTKLLGKFYIICLFLHYECVCM